MKQQVKQAVNKIMLRLFGHLPFPESKANQLKLVGGEEYGSYLFEYNSKPFDL